MKSTHKAKPKPSYPGGRRKTPPKVRKEEPRMVSDHALVRYMQRVMGVDVEVIRGSILTHEQIEMIRKLQTCKLPLGPGVYAKVVDGVVVSIF